MKAHNSKIRKIRRSLGIMTLSAACVLVVGSISPAFAGVADGAESSATLTIDVQCNSITVSSDKDISNVKVYFADGTMQEILWTSPTFSQSFDKDIDHATSKSGVTEVSDTADCAEPADETPAESPEAPAESPEAPAETPEAPAESPEAPAETPAETPAESPEAPAETPAETPAESPEAPAATPEVPASTPDGPPAPEASLGSTEDTQDAEDTEEPEGSEIRDSEDLGDDTEIDSETVPVEGSVDGSTDDQVLDNLTTFEDETSSRFYGSRGSIDSETSGGTLLPYTGGSVLAPLATGLGLVALGLMLLTPRKR